MSGKVYLHLIFGSYVDDEPDDSHTSSSSISVSSSIFCDFNLSISFSSVSSLFSLLSYNRDKIEDKLKKQEHSGYTVAYSL